MSRASRAKSVHLEELVPAQSIGGAGHEFSFQLPATSFQRAIQLRAYQLPASSAPGLLELPAMTRSPPPLEAGSWQLEAITHVSPRRALHARPPR